MWPFGGSGRKHQTAGGNLCLEWHVAPGPFHVNVFFMFLVPGHLVQETERSLIAPAHPLLQAAALWLTLQTRRTKIMTRRTV